MQLTAHFSLAEMTRNGAGLPNDPNPMQTESLRRLCENVLEPLRTQFGPVHVNSGFRSPAVNVAAGSKTTTSQHLYGEAADIRIDGVDPAVILRWLVTAGVPFDQAIAETRAGKLPYTWAHLSYGPRNRRQTLSSLDGTHYSAFAG